MRAMVMTEAGRPLEEQTVKVPEPEAGELLIRVKACGVCRTDLHIVDGELTEPKLPLIPGHEVIGTVEQCGPEVERFEKGDRVGVPWLAWTCGSCKYCEKGKENLCEQARFTGYTVDGGYAEYCVASAAYCVPLDDSLFNAASAPLLCAGLIGYRSYRLTHPEEVEHLGLYGFGASAHLLAQLAVFEKKQVYAFTREGDTEAQDLARRLGCSWAGSSKDRPPQTLDAAIVFAPIGELMVEALKVLDKGGRVVSAGIHMSPIPGFAYKHLWEERSMHSVANLERKDSEEFMEKAVEAGIETSTTAYPLEDANQALKDLREGEVTGAAVLKI